MAPPSRIACWFICASLLSVTMRCCLDSVIKSNRVLHGVAGQGAAQVIKPPSVIRTADPLPPHRPHLPDCCCRGRLGEEEGYSSLTLSLVREGSLEEDESN